MIDGEDDQGLVVFAGLLQVLEDAPDAGIGFGNESELSGSDLAKVAFAQAPRVERIVRDQPGCPHS